MLEEALNYVRKGNNLVVWQLDRLGRSLPHLITTMTGLEERGIGFKSLTENIDTTTSGGKLIFHIFGALAEFERNLIRERTLVGLTAARARGRRGGKPKVLTARQRSIAQSVYDDLQTSIVEICQTLKISKATLYRSIKTGKETSNLSTVKSRRATPDSPKGIEACRKAKVLGANLALFPGNGWELTSAPRGNMRL